MDNLIFKNYLGKSFVKDMSIKKSLFFKLVIMVLPVVIVSIFPLISIAQDINKGKQPSKPITIDKMQRPVRIPRMEMRERSIDVFQEAQQSLISVMRNIRGLKAKISEPSPDTPKQELDIYKNIEKPIEEMSKALETMQREFAACFSLKRMEMIGMEPKPDAVDNSRLLMDHITSTTLTMKTVRKSMDKIKEEMKIVKDPYQKAFVDYIAGETDSLDRAINLCKIYLQQPPKPKPPVKPVKVESKR